MNKSTMIILLVFVGAIGFALTTAKKSKVKTTQKVQNTVKKEVKTQTAPSELPATSKAPQETIPVETPVVEESAPVVIAEQPKVPAPIESEAPKIDPKNSEVPSIPAPHKPIPQEEIAKIKPPTATVSASDQKPDEKIITKDLEAPKEDKPIVKVEEKLEMALYKLTIRKKDDEANFAPNDKVEELHEMATKLRPMVYQQYTKEEYKEQLDNASNYILNPDSVNAEKSKAAKEFIDLIKSKEKEAIEKGTVELLIPKDEIPPVIN